MSHQLQTRGRDIRKTCEDTIFSKMWLKGKHAMFAQTGRLQSTPTQTFAALYNCHEKQLEPTAIRLRSPWPVYCWTRTQTSFQFKMYTDISYDYAGKTMTQYLMTRHTTTKCQHQEAVQIKMPTGKRARHLWPITIWACTDAAHTGLIQLTNVGSTTHGSQFASHQIASSAHGHTRRHPRTAVDDKNGPGNVGGCRANEKGGSISNVRTSAEACEGYVSKWLLCHGRFASKLGESLRVCDGARRQWIHPDRQQQPEIWKERNILSTQYKNTHARTHARTHTGRTLDYNPGAGLSMNHAKMYAITRRMDRV